MNAPLSRFLVEFTGDPVAVDDLCDLAPESPVEVERVTMTPDEYEACLLEARLEAAALTRAEVEAEAKASGDAERAELLEGFQAERDALVQNYGQALSDSLTATMAQLEGVVAQALADALRPVFAQAYRDRILAELAATVSALLADPGHPPLRIEGPVDLLTAFGDAQGGALALDYVVADQAELTVVADGTRIVTRLSDCLARFQASEG